LPYRGANSLLETVGRFESDLHRDVRVVRFGEADIVRDELVRWFARVMGEPAGRDGGYDYEPPLTYPYSPNGSSR
jgi:hypothetical protein